MSASATIPCAAHVLSKEIDSGRISEIIGAMETLDRITFDPTIMGGKPCIRGMRVTVGTIVGLIAAGKTYREILDLYPYLEEEDINQCLKYATWRSEEREVMLEGA